MYKIAICDDESIFAQSLSDITKKLLKELHIPFLLDIYTSCEKLLDAVHNNTDAYHLLLLDILMDGMNGMELARNIRQKNNIVTIVFITSTPDFSLQGYEVRAFHYLIKPISESALIKILEYDYCCTFQQKMLTVREGVGFRQLEIGRISHLETHGRKVAVHLPDEIVLVSAKLSEMENQLPQNRFVRCHQSFILNMDNVTELRHGEAVMKEGERIPISRAYLQKVQKTFLDKLGGK